MTVSSIEVHRSGDDGEGECISIEITEPNTFDLVELKEQGLEKLLARQEIATGKYTQIKIDYREG